MYYEEDEANMFSKIYYSIIYYIANYGWYILIALIALAIVYTKKIQPLWEKYRNYKFEQEYAAKYHKNPELFSAHVAAQQKYVDKLQEKYNRAAEEHDNKMKDRAEKKRREAMENFTSEGHVLGSRSEDDKDAQSLKPGYNPLMGPGPSSSYRPPRRSPCGGGGCGRR